MISIDNLNGTDQDRLRNVLLARSSFEAFAVDVGGRRLTVWVMTDAVLAKVEEGLDVRPTPAPEEPKGPPARKPVPIRTGVEASRPRKI